jgi:hypothetical protein
MPPGVSTLSESVLVLMADGLSAFDSGLGLVSEHASSVCKPCGLVFWGDPHKSSGYDA